MSLEWIPIYRELALKIPDFRNRQDELLKILKELKEKNLPVIRLLDRDANRNDIPLKVMDPFTFFANFNRQVKFENRTLILQDIKEKLDLKEDVPTDFGGIPIADNRSSWFFGWKYMREENNIDLLWDMAKSAITKKVRKIDSVLFNKCLKMKGVSPINLSMGCFWFNPDEFLSLDSVNRQYCMDKYGVDLQASDYDSYIRLMDKVKNVTSERFPKISYDAWIYATEDETSEDSETIKDSDQEESDEKYYWTYAPGSKARFWDEFYTEGIMAIGWDELGDLKRYKEKEDVIKNFIDVYKPEQNPTNDALACYEFAHEIQKNDIIFAKKGRTEIIGIGIVSSDYYYDKTREYFKNVRKVKWLKKGSWFLKKGMTAGKTLTNITRWKDEFKYILDLALGSEYSTELSEKEEINDVSQDQSYSNQQLQPEYTIQQFAEETGFDLEDIRSWHRQLVRKKHIVFQGSPGTGKTFAAEKMAKLVISKTSGFFEIVQFHPAYSYEDFIQGFRPVSEEEKAGFHLELVPGKFLEFCTKAQKTDDACVLIIDEINRAHLARVFGELMYLLEYRDNGIRLSSGSGLFQIPENVFIIGTMNTADRSIALVDHALRRRFAFIRIRPQYKALTYHLGKKYPVNSLIQVLEMINKAIGDINYEIGISFFLKDTKDLKKNMPDIWKSEIEPYLEEFFYDNPQKVDAFRWKNLVNNELKDWAF